jgi:site-specific recombinase XerD
VHDLAVAEGSGYALRVTQAFLGHQNQATTERYVQIGRERLARDHLLLGRHLLRRTAI